MISVPEHSIMINRRRIFHGFKLRQNTPLSDLFNFNFPSSSNFQNIVSNWGRLLNLATWFSKFSQQFQLRKHRSKLRQNASLSDLVFNFFSADPSSKELFQIPLESTS